MKYRKHISDEDVCPGCEDRLSEAHQYLSDWFRFFKHRFPTMHVSWSFRNEEYQNNAFSNGDSKLQWPNSKHNKTSANGKPCSEALDIFQIDGKGRAVFDPIFCARVNDESKKNGHTRLRWGGEFKSLGDSGHFEVRLT